MKKAEGKPMFTIPTGSAMERIRMMLPYFSKGHLKVAEYILENYEKAVFLTSFKMGQQCGISESSVIRFATTLGYSGYSEMQRELQDLLKLQLPMSQRLKETSLDDEGSIMRNIMRRGIEGIRYTTENLNEQAFNRVVDLLAHSERVFLIGSRSSYGLVYFFGYVLNWIRESVHALDGGIGVLDDIATLTERDLVLAISLPRYPRSTVKILEAAHKRGAHTVAITDTMTSPLVPFAETSLLVYTELLSYSDNIAPVMCLITALVTAVGAVDQQRTAGLLEKHEQYWEEAKLYI